MIFVCENDTVSVDIGSWFFTGGWFCYRVSRFTFQVILRNTNGSAASYCMEQFLSVIVYQETSASTLWLNASINGNPSCLFNFNLYGRDEYTWGHCCELMWGVRISIIWEPLWETKDASSTLMMVPESTVIRLSNLRMDHILLYDKRCMSGVLYTCTILWPWRCTLQGANILLTTGIIWRSLQRFLENFFCNLQLQIRIYHQGRS